MTIKSCLFSSLPILDLAVSGYRDELNALTEMRSKPPRDLIAVHPRQSDVYQCHIRILHQRELYATRAVCGHLDPMARQLKRRT